MKKFIFVILIVSFLGICTYLGIKYYNQEFKVVEKKFERYISSDENSITVKSLDDNKNFSVIRGEKVIAYEKDITLENDTTKYKRIKYKNNYYLTTEENLVEEYKDSIKEKEMYVRTSSTLYKNKDNPDINGFIKKNEKVLIKGFDYLNEDGSVNMYQVDFNENEGFLYSKYLVNNLEDASKHYEENEVYSTHKDRKYSFELFGGSPANLDYYPYEKPEFESNPLKSETKTYYLTGSRYVLADVDKYIELGKKHGATAFVIDIKDGALAYKSEVSKVYSQTSYDTAMNNVEFYKEAIKKIQDAGFYTIGRIVLFNDSIFAKDNPDECIKSPDGNSTSWVSAYSRKAWEYNVKLALESIDLFNFNEIQFDYVRFPEASFNWSKNNYNFGNLYNEEKAETIQNFLFYATDQIHLKEKYISIDVFGECSGEYVTAYGQYWPAISNIVDVVSAMPYTDHFDRNDSSYWKQPYNTMLKWGKTAAERQKEIKTPAKVRTWITAYDTPYWNVTTPYGANEIEQQVKGLVDSGLGYGFITWNARSDYNKYNLIGPAFSKEY